MFLFNKTDFKKGEILKYENVHKNSKKRFKFVWRKKKELKKSFEIKKKLNIGFSRNKIGNKNYKKLKS